MFFNKKNKNTSQEKANPTSENKSFFEDKVNDTFEDEVVKIDDDDIEVLLDNEEAVEKKLSGVNSLTKYLEIGKIMFGMVKDIKRGAYTNVPWFTIATIVMSLLYVLNPMDLVPDFIPGIGYLDDLAIFSIGIGWIESDIHKYLDWKIEQTNL
ncbi:hypothetical protein ULMS_26470 [Patiriisocius marinistellae]|uniref:DUF1232 domain-containing protein n=1 Tax=Patiriisocius marinistellae TaxID=2494560 RepID=A0A5J4G2Q6_9FLAO|nr:YkvA family protein [Patiriisocius marinistellae]GEQ87139.1 hypothetical protein ULMS_26470 [Patiriisocius marinistellae]